MTDDYQAKSPVSTSALLEEKLELKLMTSPRNLIMFHGKTKVKIMQRLVVFIRCRPGLA